MANELAPNGPTPATHPKGFFFLFAGEFAERFSFYGMRAILPLYLSDQLGFGDARGGLYYTIFLGMCYLLPLLGGYIADNFLGKYWTIVGFSIPYVVGQFLVGFESTYTLVLALGLLAMGTGVIKPNISTLMGLTYDQKRPGQDKLRSNAFQYFYMSINIGAFLSQTIVPVVRDQTGSYFIAFCVPAVFMILALGLFAAGKKYYAVETVNRERPAGHARAAGREVEGARPDRTHVLAGDVLLGRLRPVVVHLGLLRADVHGSDCLRLRVGAGSDPGAEPIVHRALHRRRAGLPDLYRRSERATVWWDAADQEDVDRVFADSSLHGHHGGGRISGRRLAELVEINDQGRRDLPADVRDQSVRSARLRRECRSDIPERHALDRERMDLRQGQKARDVYRRGNHAPGREESCHYEGTNRLRQVASIVCEQHCQSARSPRDQAQGRRVRNGQRQDSN